MTCNIVVTIMAAGEGKRMNSTVPKVLHLFRNKPMLLRIIESSLLLYPKKIIIITGKYDELIRSTLSEYMDISNLIFVKQQIPCGTGDAIKCCLMHYADDEKILILNGDMPLINEIILHKFICHSLLTDINILVANFDDPKGYGRVIYNNNGEFIRIIEEKDCNSGERDIKTINSGLYFITAELLRTYIPIIDNNNNQCEYYLTDIVKVIKEHTDIIIGTYLIDPSYNIFISGVNTQEELFALK